jgi:hypothetical protein
MSFRSDPRPLEPDFLRNIEFQISNEWNRKLFFFEHLSFDMLSDLVLEY